MPGTSIRTVKSLRSRGRGAGVDQLPVGLHELLRDADLNDAGSPASAYLKKAFKLMQREPDPIHRTIGCDMKARVDPFEVGEVLLFIPGLSGLSLYAWPMRCMSQEKATE